MSSIDKLKRLTGEKTTKPAAPSAKQSQIDELRRRMDMILSRRPQQPAAAPKKDYPDGRMSLEKIVPGEEIENKHGKFFLASDILAGNCRHGRRNICEALNLDMRAAGVLAGDYTLSGCRCEEGLFLDTETTGLSGGTGTMAFLIGLGWFEEGAFHIRQIFARDFSEERAALSYLAEIAAQKKFLVTFNGKAFDVNLLSTRFILNRLKSDLVNLPHLDLLHPSRRILGIVWKTAGWEHWKWKCWEFFAKAIFPAGKFRSVISTGSNNATGGSWNQYLNTIKLMLFPWRRLPRI